MTQPPLAPKAPPQLEALSEQGAKGKRSLFETVFNLPKPKCCSHGDCCKGASPSVPVHKLWAKAAAGEAFAQGFLSIFEPYESHEAAAAVVPGLVERILKAAEKSADFAGPEDVVFYRCRYLQPDNRCGVYEDRPQFCRDYPDTPLVVMAPGCAFEEWGQQCKSKYQALQAETETLKALQDELEQGNTPALGTVEAFRSEQETLEALALVLSLTPTYLATPLHSYL